MHSDQPPRKNSFTKEEDIIEFPKSNHNANLNIVEV